MEKEPVKKNIIVKCIFPFVMAIITFIIGIFFFVSSKGDPFLSRLAIILIGYLPTIIFLILVLVGYYKCNTIKSMNSINIATSVLTIFLLWYYIFAIFLAAGIEASNPVTGASSYSDKVYGKRLLNVFPKEIPSNVDNVEFNYRPGFLQGGTEIALYYIDLNMTLDKFDKMFRDKAEWIGYKNEYDQKQGLFTGAFSSTPAEYNNEQDYIIYLVEGRCDDSGYCNHGDFLFAAFNDKTNEVIYKSEEW